ncbi:MAG TPA: M28 family peptidase [Sphingomicrobium sp.]|nr:M28 family peptidase [Sphingomicrobium sp.]
MRRDTLLALALIFLVLLALFGKSLLVALPPVRHVDGQFDADRAKARLAFILGDQQPHPVDSAQDDAVRERLVETLRHMGLKPVIRDQVACNNVSKARLIACARVRNVIAALGPLGGKTLLLSAHYDSVPLGPGAADDGIGVATLLEVGSILRMHPPKRPVLLLFNEGEELGLLGARAFLADPLSRNVDSLLNFEARGVNGPVTMFETSQPNGSAIAAYARSVDHPYASSLSTDVARLIPNDTDVTTFKERPWITLNSAIVGNETRYHSAGDNLAGLEVRSLQDMGNEALALTVRLSAAVPQDTGNRVFLDIGQSHFVDLPVTLAAVWLMLLLGSLAFLAIRRRVLVRGTALVIAALVAASSLGWLAVTIMGLIRKGAYWRAHGELTFAALYATVLLGAFLVLRIGSASFALKQVRLAYWFTFVLLGAIVALAAPGGIIYFLFPPSALLGGVLLARRYPRAERAGACLAILLQYFTWAELLAQIEAIFSPGPIWLAAPVAAIMIAPVLIEATLLFRRARPRMLVSAASGIVLLSWIIAGTAPAYSQNQQERFTIEHVTEFPSGRSSWSVLNDGARLPAAYSNLGPWKRRSFDFSQRERWISPAPSLTSIRPASAKILNSVTNGSERWVRLQIEGHGAERVLLVAPAEAHITAAGMSGAIRHMGADDSTVRFTLSCAGRSCNQTELIIGLRETGPVTLTIVGSRNGLPPSAAQLVRARPQYARPQYVPDETVTVFDVTI